MPGELVRRIELGGYVVTAQVLRHYGETISLQPFEQFREVRIIHSVPGQIRQGLLRGVEHAESSVIPGLESHVFVVAVEHPVGAHLGAELVGAFWLHCGEFSRDDGICPIIGQRENGGSK